MNIALAQLNYHIGNFEQNTSKIIEYIKIAEANGADLVCFGELSICGYPPRDFLEFDDFIDQCQKAIQKIMQHTTNIGVIVGAPSVNPVLDGKDLFNSAYFLYENKIIGLAHKALLPTYDIFDEYRYFEPATEFKTIEFKGKKVALTVCEDIWNIANENPLYTLCPMDELIKERPDFMVNISASPFSYDHASDRIDIVRNNSRKYELPMYYVNHVGAQTEIIFDGGSLVCASNGNLVAEMPYFEESIQYFDLESCTKPDVVHQENPKDKWNLIHQALLCGLRDYFGKLGFSKAIIGLSGGIDSALTATLASQALGSENVHVLLMPSQYSSDHSVKDALDLCKNLGISYDIFEIEPIYNAFSKTLSEKFKGLEQNVTEENLQARSRGLLLMAMSNKFGHILLNTTNKSEMAVGYGTLYGDLCGGLSVIADLYKTEVFELSRWINRNGEVIPWNSIEKPPSAELRPNQKDSDSLPEYDVLDPILFEYIENRLGPKEIIAMGYEEKLVRRILRLVNINEFKRYQTAPVLRVSNKAFGMGRRMPIVAKYLS